MVKTRSGDALPDNIDSEMPVRDTSEAKIEPQDQDEEGTISSRQHESSEDKDITYRPGWGRELRNRFVFGRRAKREGMSSRRRYAEDDGESRDEMLSDDSEDIFPRRRRSVRTSRLRVSLRHHGHRLSRRIRHNQEMAAQDMNGAESAEEKPSPGNREGEGVRRSTRMRKQKYDNFNNSWIDGMNGHQPLRGYPSPFSDKSAKQEKKEEAADAATGYVYMTDNKDDDKPSEQGTSREHGMKRARTLAELDTAEGENPEDDMYSRVKRLRRPAQRYMFDDDSAKPTGRIADHQRETQSSSSSDSESEVEAAREARKYSLRKTKPAVDRFQASIDPPRAARSARVLRSMLRRHAARRGRSSSTSSSDEERFDRRPKAKTLTGKGLMNLASGGPGDVKPTNTLADVDPMTLDKSIMFANVGGLEDHIRCLKEMVVFPLMYREVFERFHIQPAKGVLFHGPPGTGKTLLARALANECSQGERKMAFFMRKGADCLTKWVGESERQLRLLFEQAYQMRPSIIFFDEMDGLAPVRSSKQDQIHASIVSTLLALMDGLDNRGEVIVIGATNRIDAIDPALRRPGRFDRELYFPLPARQERQEILRIHVSQWQQPPTDPLLTSLAEQAAGYCGSDLRALCSEAVLQGLRRRYPQIYNSSQKLLLDPAAVQVEREDFLRARSTIIPAAHRCAPSAARKLSALVEPLLSEQVARAVHALADSFPHALSKTVGSEEACGIHKPRLLLCAPTDAYGQAHAGPAILAHMEHVPVHSLSLSTLFHSASTTPEEVTIQVFNEARRNPPSVVYVPGVGALWELLSETVRAVFLSKLRELEPCAPVLLLATSERPYDQLPEEVSSLFSRYRSEVVPLRLPTCAERRLFFAPLLLEEAAAPPAPHVGEKELEPLPLAPPPPPPALSTEQMTARYEQEEATLRELRIFLRDCCSKLARNRLFFMFTKPVDIQEVPDYLNIIKQPMDLETIMTKIDMHRYTCAREFLDDIELVVTNALEYNPDRTGEDKLIRHRAHCLRDTAQTLIKTEMDTDYETKCRQISRARKERMAPTSAPAVAAASGSQATPALSAAPVPATSTPVASNQKAVASSILQRAWRTQGRKYRRKNNWSRGMLKAAKRTPKSSTKPLVARETGIPVTHAPVLPSDSDSDQPLVNGAAKSSELVKAASLETKRHSAESRGKPASETKKSPPDAKGKTHAGMNGITPHKTSPRFAAKKTGGVPNGSVSDAEEPVVAKRRGSSVNVAPDCDSNADSFDITFNESFGADEPAPDAELTAHDGAQPETLSVDVPALKALLERCVSATDGHDFDTVVDLRSQLAKLVRHCRDSWDRTHLPQLLSKELDRFEKMKMK